MRKCLIVQFEPRHEEVIPSVIAACNAAGYRPTVVLNRRIRRIRGDVFQLVQGGEADIQYARTNGEVADGAVNWAELLSDEIDFVVLNTFNRPKAALWARDCGKPVIALVHNTDQFMADPVFHEALERPNFAAMTLAPHVTSELLSRLNGKHIDKFGLLTYCVFSDTPVPYAVPKLRKVVVPGNMSLRSRDYMGLIKTLSAHPGRWDNLTFEFPSSGADRDQIAAEIEAHGLSDRMHILPPGPMGEVPHAQVYESFRTATLFHPLIPDGFAQYQRTKITSTASMSVGFGVPLIMDRWSEACYRFPMLVSDNSIEASLERLSTVSDADLMAINSMLTAYRGHMMKTSGLELARLVEQVLF